MNNASASFDYNVLTEQSNETHTVIHMSNFNGDFDGLPVWAADCEGINSINENEIELTIEYSLSSGWPTAKEIFYFICRAIRKIVCPDCMGG